MEQQRILTGDATPASEAERATPGLSRLIESLIDAAAVPERASLGDVREVVARDGIFIRDGELLHPQDRTSLVIELDDLIRRHGAGAPARDQLS